MEHDDQARFFWVAIVLKHTHMRFQVGASKPQDHQVFHVFLQTWMPHFQDWEPRSCPLLFFMPPQHGQRQLLILGGARLAEASAGDRAHAVGPRCLDDAWSVKVDFHRGDPVQNTVVFLGVGRFDKVDSTTCRKTCWCCFSLNHDKACGEVLEDGPLVLAWLRSLFS